MLGPPEQQYHVLEFTTFHPVWPVLNFEHPKGFFNDKSFICQMFAMNVCEMKLIVQRSDNVMAGIGWMLNRIWPFNCPELRLKTIRYVLSACDGSDKVRRQEFIHKFYGHTFVTKDNVMICRDGVLIKRYGLNHLLEADTYGKLSGLQFVA